MFIDYSDDDMGFCNILLITIPCIDRIGKTSVSQLKLWDHIFCDFHRGMHD